MDFFFMALELLIFSTIINFIPKIENTKHGIEDCVIDRELCT